MRPVKPWVHQLRSGRWWEGRARRLSVVSTAAYVFMEEEARVCVKRTKTFGGARRSGDTIFDVDGEQVVRQTKVRIRVRTVLAVRK